MMLSCIRTCQIDETNPTISIPTFVSLSHTQTYIQAALVNNVVNVGIITSIPESPRLHGPKKKIVSSSFVIATVLATNGLICPNSYPAVRTMPLRIIGIHP